MNKVTMHFEDVYEGMSLVDQEEVLGVAAIVRKVRVIGRRVYVCGNGGSHATASHFANDLVKQNHIKAHCVGDESPTVYAYGNDNGWEDMYAGALKVKLEERDCVFGISCSGNSMNVIRALELAKQRGAFAVGLTGLSKSSRMSFLNMDGLVYVPVPDIRVQEDIHLAICHAIVRLLQDNE